MSGFLAMPLWFPAVMKKAIVLVLDIIELYVPAVTFIVLFVVFVLQIFFRYVVNRPLTWAYELTVLCFIWTTLLGACYIRRKKKHICFEMFYENRSAFTQTLFRIIGNTIIAVICIAAFYPTAAYLHFKHVDKSPVLRIPFSIGFFPVLIFVTLIALHSLKDVVEDLRVLWSQRGTR